MIKSTNSVESVCLYCKLLLFEENALMIGFNKECLRVNIVCLLYLVCGNILIILIWIASVIYI